MPKTAPPDSCATCLQRKVKCDGRQPICRKCAIRNRDCVRPDKGIKFVISGSRSNSSHRKAHSGEDANPTSVIRTPVESLTYPAPPVSLSINDIQALASSTPANALRDTDITKVLAHYVAVLAPWYDLNDPARTFGTIVPRRALSVPILFKAIVAFSACHQSKINGMYADIAALFHAACVREFLMSMEQPDLSNHGDKLASTCLLRSYEIINGGSHMEHHLLGAYSYAVSHPIDFSIPGLLRTGAWNYLREEITAGLIRRRGVRIGQIFDNHAQGSPEHQFPSDQVSYILARIINFAFSDPLSQTSLVERRTLWHSLNSDLMTWKANLPSDFQSFSSAVKSNNPFPSLWMLRPWHVAAYQYRAVAEIMLTLYDPSPDGGHLSRRSFDFAQEQALQVCGLAWTNEDDAARVNAFGPLAFCGRYLSLKSHQLGLEKYLRESSLSIGWPADDIIEDLRKHWASEYP